MPITPKRFVRTEFTAALATLRSEIIGSPRSIPASEFYVGPSPEELHQLYTQGYRGIRPESVTPEEKREIKDFFASMPSLYEIFPWAKGIGKGKISAPFYAALHFRPEFGGEDAQVQGDCTVHGETNACAMDYYLDCLFGETVFKGPLAFENVYRSRGFNGDGWSCEAPCMYVGPNGRGGVLYRRVYEGPNGEKVDLTKYNSQWQSNGRAGVPAWLEEQSRQNKVKWVIPIGNAEEYRDAIALGFGINVCSGQGFASSTDENGVAAARGSWSHAMAHTSCVDTEWARNKYGDMIGGIQQSWGKWNTQNGKPDGIAKLPVGMFFSKFSTINSMLRGGDSFAMCSVYGYDRVGMEAFDVTGLMDHLTNSTTQDYYKHRQEQVEEYGEKAYDEFLAI